MAGILAGAIAGGAKAMQWNAQGQIEEKRKRALMTLEQEMAMERQDDQQAFTAGENDKTRTFQRSERIEGQEFTAGENQADRQLSRWQTGVQQSGADRRAAMGRNDWELVPLEGGGYGRYNTRTGQYEDASLPEGAVMSGADGELSDRDKYQLDGIADRMETIRDRASDEMRELTPDEKAELGRLQGQYDSLLSNSGGSTLFQRLMAGEGGGDAEGEPPPLIAQPGAESPGNARADEDGASASDFLAERRQRQEAAEQNAEADTRVGQLADQADQLAEQVGPQLRPGGLINSVRQAAGQNGQARQEAQSLLAELSAAYDAESDDDRRAILARAMGQLQDAGVTLDQP